MARYVTRCHVCGNDRVRIYGERGEGCVYDRCKTCFRRGVGLAALWLFVLVAALGLSLA